MRTGGVRGVRRSRRGCKSTSGFGSRSTRWLQEQERGQRGTARVHGGTSGRRAADGAGTATLGWRGRQRAGAQRRPQGCTLTAESSVRSRRTISPTSPAAWPLSPSPPAGCLRSPASSRSTMRWTTSRGVKCSPGIVGAPPPRDRPRVRRRCRAADGSMPPGPQPPDPLSPRTRASSSDVVAHSMIQSPTRARRSGSVTPARRAASPSAAPASNFRAA